MILLGCASRLIIIPSNRKRSPKGRSPDTVAEGNLYGVVLLGILIYYESYSKFYNLARVACFGNMKINMVKKIRLLFFSLLIILFFVFSPILIFYSQGYRFDFDEKRIVKTGGLNVRVSPLGAEIYLNNKLVGKTTILLSSVFVQNLLPKEYRVTVKKEGYFPWEKILKIEEQMVTKAEKIILFPEKTTFTPSEEKIEYFLSPADSENRNSLFFVKNNILFKQELEEKEPQKILENLLTFEVSNNNIFWLSGEGLLIKSDFNGKILEVLNKTPYPIKKEVKYLIKILPKETIFLVENNLFYLNKEKGIFEKFLNNFNNFKISPDFKKILIFSNHEIWLSNLEGEKIFLNRFSENIGDCFWLNPYYLVFNAENKIKIIEVDNRDKPNLYELKAELGEKGSLLEIENPKIYFNEINKKLYLQTKENLYSSEPLL